MKRIQKIFSLLGISAILVVSFQNCGTKYQFESKDANQKNSGSPGAPAEIVLPDGLKQVITKLEIERTQNPIDMVWVVDNSASMGDIAAQVRANFDRFLSTLGIVSDIRLALVSTTTGTTRVVLPTQVSNQFTQINLDIDSNNPLLVANSLFCNRTVTNQPTSCELLNADQSGLFNSSVITRYSGNNLINYVREQQDFAQSVRSQLVVDQSFFRANSKKIFVFVTDDESFMSSSVFKAMGQAAFGVVPTVFSFVEKNSQVNCGTRKGQIYMDLSASTGGQSYDICETDWSVHFAKLTADIVKVTGRFAKIPVEIQAKNIVAIKVNGKVIPNTLYLIKDSVIQFLAGTETILTENMVIEILYK